MIKSVELKNVIRELVKTNFETTLDADKMSVIVTSIYDDGKEYTNVYNYLMKKWKRANGNKLLKSEVNHITPDFINKCDTIEETVSEFFE